MNHVSYFPSRWWVNRSTVTWLACAWVLCAAAISSPAYAQCNPCSVWSTSTVPGNAADSDSSSVELGLKFRSDVAGLVTGVRFYKAATNTGTHVGHLWTRAGALLATVTFSGETGSGWQEASFATPVSIQPNTTYIISYYAPNGHYAGDNGYFASAGTDNAPLHALANGADGGNGVYLYGTGGGFPQSTWQSSNYWVDVVFTPTTADTTPPTVTAVSPAAGASGVSLTTTVTATFSEAIDPATLNSNTVRLFDPVSNVVPASITYTAATRTVTITPTVTLAASTTYLAVVTGGTVDPRVKDVAGNALATDYSWTFATASPPPPQGTCPCTIWAPTVSPVLADAGADNSAELGVKFRADSSGYITGIRFYKSTANTGTHVGNLWSSTGELLASVTFAGESASGWQEATFSPAVAITAGTTYVASYHATAGHYGFDQNFFANGVDNTPLHALSNAVAGGNGVFAYGSSSVFPNGSFNATNYWVDVVFDFTAVDTTPPAVSSVSPASGATGVSVGGVVKVTFSEAIDASTVNSATFYLRDSSNAPVAGAVTYDSSSWTAIFTPSGELTPLSVYTATVVGGTSDPRIKDAAGNALAASTTWSFTTGSTPPVDGPGGPILVLASATNSFSRYYGEILRAEGLNAFTVTDVSSLSASLLSGYDVVIVGDFALTAAQVSVLTTWVNAGGNLIAMRPDKQLAALLGLTDASATLANAYLRINTVAGPGAGLVSETIQFHGVADRYTLNGAASLATLYSTAATATASPAVTLRAVGAGQAAAFTYDLARSIVYTRQGNPAWSGDERDGVAPIRSDDLFYGAASGDVQPDWIDLNKVQIPQADEQQRLLANLILTLNQAKKPLPRFWYLPRGLKAAVVMTGDDHASGDAAGRFDTYIADSPANCSLDNWECVRGTAYLEIPNGLTSAQALHYASLGFEIGLHIYTGCADWTPTSLESFFATQLADLTAAYPGLPSPTTERTHCIVWSDYDSHALIDFNHGVRFDTNYYYWPPDWLSDRPGFFTGSGWPMRFATRTGDLVDVYQAATQMTDESGQSYPFTIDTLLDNALGSPGYYGVFTANMHTDSVQSDGSDAIVASAQARGVPIVTALQMLRWLDGRNGSAFGNIGWNGTALTFSVSVAAGAKGLQVMLPFSSANGMLTAITLNGSPVAYTTSVVKGIQYAWFAAAAGAYQATYGGALPTATLTPSSLAFADQPVGTASAAQPVLLTNTGAAALTITSIATSGDYSQTNACGTTLTAGASCTINVMFTPSLNGTRTGMLTVIDSGSGSPRTVSLSGNGTGTLPSVTWVAGDMHVHRSCGGSPESVSSIYDRMSTNDIAVTSLLADMGNGEVQNPTTDLPLVNGQDASVSTPGRIVHWDAEWHWDATYTQYGHQALGGHIVALGLNAASQFWSEYTKPVFDWAHQRGGIAGFVHMQYLDNGIDNLTCCTPIEYPVEVALGSADFIAEDVTGSDVAIDAYYKLLNTGFRPGFAAGTDYPCGVSETGGLLTYVAVPAGQMTYRNWINGIAAGRTVVSRNGTNEFMELTVNGSARPGDEIDLAAPGTVPVTIHWTANQSLSGTIELVKNGDVVSSWGASAAPGVPADVTANVSFDKSGWLAARRMGSNGHVLQTGAVFVVVANAPIRASAADAQYYVNWMDTLLSRTSPGGVWNSYFPTSLVAAQARYSAAKAIYQQIAAEASGPSVTLLPASLTFGPQAVGSTSASQTVILSNTGNAIVNVSSVTIAGANASEFTKTSTCPSSLGIGASCSIAVTFTPTATGTRTATLTVTDSAAGSPHSVALSGTGTSLVTASLLPTALTFAAQAVGTTSTPAAVTLTNTGNGALAIASISASGDYAQTNNCPASPSTLAAGSACTINVTFTPTATGTRAGVLTVADNGTGSPRTATLTGTGVGPAVTLAPTSLTFGSQLVNTTSGSQTVTLTNSGAASLSIANIALAGTNPSDFAIAPACPASLASGASCQVAVTFTPAATGARTATLAFTDNGPGSPQGVPLTGTGVAPAVTLTPTSVGFGSVVVGSASAGTTVTLTNSGTGQLSITNKTISGANPGDFAQTNNCTATIAPGGSCTFTVTFKPTASGSRAASLSVADTASGSPHTVALTGTGVAPAVTLSTTSIRFANQRVGTTSSASSMTVLNSGNGTLTIASITLGGPNAGDFSRTTTCGATLAAGASCTVTVRFTPTALGTRSAVLSISDNAPGSPQQVSVSGAGISAVTLSTTSLTFATRKIGTTSASSNVTITYRGSGALTISGIALGGANPGDFAFTTTCGATLATGTSCRVSVTFSPTAALARTANLVITHSDPASPQIVTLNGTGSAVSLSRTSISFGGRTVGTTSAPVTVTVTNLGTAPVAVSGIAITGTNSSDFRQTNTCGSSLAGGAACVISVTFRPTAIGTRQATLRIDDADPSSPQNVTLTGTGR